MNNNQKNIGLYVLLSLGVVLGCLPDMTMQSYSALVIFVALILAYFFRARAKKDDLVWHHSTFVVRTIWIWSLFLLIGMMGAGYIMQTQGDMSAVDRIMEAASSGIIPSEADIEAASQDYFSTNYDLILRTTLMWLAPAQVYAVWRIFKGLSRALKGYRVQNLRGWF
ncbi:MAG: hypothetical protein KDJ26_01440 [Alphaproteobacteria bacterium]|nr:hypothetical protein [Alphaproteobacteria bacterium]MCB1550643.1 hypothetical protein [Alphaproteobacteria bacterium]MCB9985955.1 hypothetical protein [Micavibrio sp.]